MSERFFVTEPIASGDVTLLGSEAHHLLHVLRAKPGQEVILFDGTGKEFTSRVVDCGRREVRLHVQTSQLVSREAPIDVSLGVALPKGDRQKWLVEKTVELGVCSLVPLITERSVSRPTSSALERLRRAVIEASKQCGRTRLMQIAEPRSCRDFFGQPCGAGDGVTLRFCAHPQGERRLSMPDPGVDRVKVAIGPEGGFAQDEIQTAQDAGWLIVSLGPRILRVETAAIALATTFTLDLAEAARLRPAPT